MKWFLAGLAGVLVLGGCTGTAVLRAGGSGTAPSAGRSSSSGAVASSSAFASLTGVVGDGEEEYLSDVAGSGAVDVAVGASHATGVWQPLLLSSRDDGRSWVPGVVTGAGATVDDAPSIVVVRGRAFYAFGEASGGMAVWISTDGRSWARHAIDRAVMGGDRDVAGVVATRAGFVAVGELDATGRRSEPMSWTSADGITWQAHLGRGAGLGPVPGNDLYLSDVAGNGREIVAVGERGFGGGDDSAPIVYRSRDGAHWQRVALADDLAGSTSTSWFRAVTWSGVEFVAVGSGGDGTGNRYAGVVARSADGADWSAVSYGPGLATKQQVYLNTVTTQSGATLAIGGQCASFCTLYGVTEGGGGWQPLNMPAGGNGDGVGVGDTTTTATGTVLVVGSGNVDHDRSPRIWRSQDGLTFTSIPLTAPAVTSTNYVAAIASGVRSYAVVGSSAGLPVVWTSTDGTHFGSPSALSRDRADAASTIEHGPAGWLVTGSREVGESTEAIIWTSTDARHWREQRSGAFGRAGLYSNSSLGAATAFHGWVVVGQRSADGNRSQSATAFRSADGRTWQAGVGAASLDLRGGPAGARQMNDVVAVGSGVLAVGWAEATRDSTGYLPAVWRSADGNRWTKIMLPHTYGWSGAVDHVAVSGRTVVGFGTQARGTQTWASMWTSTDAGGSWRVTRLAGAGGDRTSVDADVLERTSDGFLAAGSVGRPGAASPVLWRSTDGSTWRRVRVADHRLAQSGDWTVDGAAVVADRAVVIATRVSTAGSTPVLFTQPVR